MLDTLGWRIAAANICHLGKDVSQRKDWQAAGIPAAESARALRFADVDHRARAGSSATRTSQKCGIRSAEKADAACASKCVVGIEGLVH